MLTGRNIGPIKYLSNGPMAHQTRENKMTANKINIPQAVFETKAARSAIKAGHEEACDALDRRSVSQIPESDPNHPMYSVSA